MKAMVIKDFGGPEVIEQRDIDKPEPGANELLVKVKATSVNPVDYKIRRNGKWAGIEPPAVIGYDVAGIVEKTGTGVKNFKEGDEVFYTPEIDPKSGSYAEYNVAKESIVAKKPENLDFNEAASIPLAGCTAWDSLMGAALLQIPETVLIHGGAGGVGTLAIQLAKAAGARVFTTCGGYHKDFVKELGADVAIDYREEDFVEVVKRETNGEGVDVVFDCVGGDTLEKSLDVTCFRSRLVTIVDSTGDLNRAKANNVSVYYVFMQRSSETMNSLKKMIERGQIKPVIDSVMKLEEAAEAHKRLEKGGGIKGKIVLSV
jgi:NADPH:quinone reductase-like Zn-dependent oxidoreductase